MRPISRSLPTSAPLSASGSPGTVLGLSMSGIFFAWRENMTLRFSPIARCVERALLQQCSELVRREGPAEIEPLGLVAAVLLQEGDVLFRLHAFGRHFEIEFQGERDDRLG